jgi:hypothetical protein
MDGSKLVSAVRFALSLEVGQRHRRLEGECCRRRRPFGLMARQMGPGVPR